MYKWIVALILSVSLSVAFVFLNTNLEKEIQKIESLYSIKITFDFLESSIFPSDVLYQEVAAQDRRKAIKNLEYDLKKYNKEELCKYLSTIVVYKNLTIKGHKYGGTYDNSLKSIYIKSNLLGDHGRNDMAIGFHHEMSSLFMLAENARFNMNGWKTLNASDFHYEISGDKLRLGTRGSKDCFLNGFVCEYGQVSVEEDFNTFSQYFIAKPNLLFHISGKYSGVLSKKQEVIAKFYSDLGVLREFKPSFMEFLYWRNKF